MNRQLNILLAEFKRKLMAKFLNEIVSIILFGSQARGDAKKTSDTDVLIVIKSRDWHMADKIGAIAYDMMLETGIYISTKVIDQQHYRHLRQIKAPFIQNVLKEGVPL